MFRIYDEDSRPRYSYYKSISQKKSGNQNHGKPYGAPANKGNWKTSGVKETSEEGTPTSVRCFGYGWMGHRASECMSYGKKCFKCGKS